MLCRYNRRYSRWIKAQQKNIYQCHKLNHRTSTEGYFLPGACSTPNNFLGEAELVKIRRKAWLIDAIKSPVQRLLPVTKKEIFEISLVDMVGSITSRWLGKVSPRGTKTRIKNRPANIPRVLLNLCQIFFTRLTRVTSQFPGFLHRSHLHRSLLLSHH